MRNWKRFALALALSFSMSACAPLANLLATDCSVLAGDAQTKCYEDKRNAVLFAGMFLLAVVAGVAAAKWSHNNPSNPLYIPPPPVHVD